MARRAAYWMCEGLGWLLCELAFKTGCRGPFAYAYRAGCWFYGKSDNFLTYPPE
jgi:hypothetical protein